MDNHVSEEQAIQQDAVELVFLQNNNNSNNTNNYPLIDGDQIDNLFSNINRNSNSITDKDFVIKTKETVSIVPSFPIPIRIQSDAYRKGWHTKNIILKQNLIKYHNGSCYCYMCYSNLHYHNIAFSHTIPIKDVSQFEKDGKIYYEDNIFAICYGCVKDNITIPKAPKNIQEVIEFKTSNDIKSYKLSRLVDALQKNVISKEEETVFLRTRLEELNQIINNLNNHIDVSNKKLELLKKTKEENEKLSSQIIQSKRKVKSLLSKSMHDCDTYFNKTFLNFKNHYTNMLDNMNKEIRHIEEISSIEVETSIPCKICYTNSINICLSPCGHCFCQKCYEHLPTRYNEILDNNTKKCPYCKTDIKSIQKMFLCL